MLKTVIAAFTVLHGLVHLLYVGQSRRLFELQPGMTWPDGSWAFSRMLGDENTRLLAGACCLLAAAGFVAGGAGLLVQQPWSRTVLVGAASFSTLTLLLLWDGRLQRLADQGLVAIVINVGLLAALLLLQWPDSGA